MKRLLAVLVAASLVLIAAKPVPTGSIAIADADLTVPGYVAFDVTTSDLKGYPMVWVECATADGIIWGKLDHPDESFDFGGPYSAWGQLDPTPSADCTASLWAFAKKGKGVVVVGLLDSVSFHVEG